MKLNPAEAFRRRHAPSGRAELRDRDERLESLKLLVGKLAHDFNNYLAPILGYVALIKEEVSDGAVAVKYAATLEQSARRAEEGIATMLTATQPQRRFQPKIFDLSALLEEIITQWASGLGSGSGVAVSRQIEACVFEGDLAQWRALTQQLLLNARFALAMGGQLTVRLTPAVWSPAEQADLGLPVGTGWVLDFEDSGLGMSEETRRKAFDPFFTTRPKNQALGMGLTLVHSVVRWHGGQVSLESREDQGTRVRIWIPDCGALSSEPIPPASPPAFVPIARIGAQNGNKVLVVDDDPMVLEVLKSCMQRANYDVHTACDGVQALKIFERKPHDWLCIVSDVTMPNMDGIEFASKVRMLRPDARIVLVTGNSEAAPDSSLAMLGPLPPPLLRKPFTLKELMEAVASVLS